MARDVIILLTGEDRTKVPVAVAVTFSKTLANMMADLSDDDDEPTCVVPRTCTATLRLALELFARWRFCPHFATLDHQQYKRTPDSIAPFLNALSPFVQRPQESVFVSEYRQLPPKVRFELLNLGRLLDVVWLESLWMIDMAIIASGATSLSDWSPVVCAVTGVPEFTAEMQAQALADAEKQFPFLQQTL